jgi:hypothetical protein
MTLGRKLTLGLYAAIAVPLSVNYLMGLGWFGRYDKIVTWGFLGIAALVGNWFRSRAEKKADSGALVVQALDANGAVRSDPGTRRFIWRTMAGVVGMSAFVVLAMTYRGRIQGGTVVWAFLVAVIVIVLSAVCWHRFGNISEVEGDDGVTLSFRRGANTTRVPWREVESVEVGRPYAFWQVMLKFRHLGESKAQTIRFLPLGWQKMTPAVAEKLQAAIEQRRLAQ